MPTYSIYNSTPLPGDLVLCRSNGKQASVNKAAQKFVRFGRKSNYTHVAITLAANIVDSTPDYGTQCENTFSFFKKYNEISVYRNIPFESEIQDKPERCAAITSAVRKYFYQDYNWYFLIPTAIRRLFGRLSPYETFCSELAFRVYRKLGVKTGINNIFASTVLPSDFERAVKDETKWKNVTSIYHELFLSDCQDQKFGASFLELSFHEQRNIDVTHGGQVLLSRLDAIESTSGKHKSAIPTPARNTQSKKDQDLLRQYWDACQKIKESN